MRPRKRILLFCASQASAQELKFLLEVRGQYKVAIAEDIEHAKQLIHSELLEVNLIVAEVNVRTVDANTLAAASSSIPSLLFSRDINTYERASNATFFIPEMYCTSEEILTRVHILAQRKRGPKKEGSKHQAEARLIGQNAARKAVCRSVVEGALMKKAIPLVGAAFVLMTLQGAFAQSKPAAPRVAARAAVSPLAIPANQHGAELAWQTTTDDAGGAINVYRAVVAGSGNACAGTLTLLTSGVALAGPYDDTTVAAGTTLCYAVTAVVNGIESAKSNTVSGTVLPFAPTGTTAQASGKNVVLSWTASPDGGTVNIYRATSSSGPFNQVKAGVGSTTYTDTTAPAGNSYYYLTDVVNGIEGKQTATITAELAPSAPTLTLVVQ